MAHEQQGGHEHGAGHGHGAAGADTATQSSRDELVAANAKARDSKLSYGGLLGKSMFGGRHIVPVYKADERQKILPASHRFKAVMTAPTAAASAADDAAAAAAMGAAAGGGAGAGAGTGTAVNDSSAGAAGAAGMRRFGQKIRVDDELVDGSDPLVIKVYTYNVLSQARAKLSNFPFAHAVVLNWVVRRQRLLEELLDSDADVLLLQDVDNFDGWWYPQLRVKGYDGIFQKRESRSRVGVAIFFKRERFQLFKSEALLLDDACDVVPRHEASRFRRGDVGLLAMLQPWEGAPFPTGLCIASIQLTPGKHLGGIRRVQMEVALQKLQAFNQDFGLPLAIGVNSYEEPGTDVYHCLATGYMPQLPRVPRAPTNVTAIALSMSSMRVDWTPPKDPGDAPITSYRIEKRTGGNKVIGFVLALTVPATEECGIITGLASGLCYEFRVSAVNDYGIGLGSHSTPPVTTPMPKGRAAAHFIELRRASNISVASIASERSQLEMAASRSGFTPRFDGGGSFSKINPSSTGSAHGPGCDASCKVNHVNRVHRFDLSSAYEAFALLCPEETAEMKAFIDAKMSQFTSEDTDYVQGRVHTKHGATTTIESAFGENAERVKEIVDSVVVTAPMHDDVVKTEAAEEEEEKGTAQDDSGAKDEEKEKQDTTQQGNQGRTAVDDDGKQSDDDTKTDKVDAEADAADGKAGDADGAAASAEEKQAAAVVEAKVPEPGSGALEPPCVHPGPWKREPHLDSYLFHSRGVLQLRGILSLPSPNTIAALDKKGDVQYLPNRGIASDHLLMGAWFTLDEDKVPASW